MSKETVVKFLDAVEKSPELKKQVMPVQADERPENMKKIIDIASKAGYAFSEDDLKAAIKARAEGRMKSGQQLSEADLEKVAGGRWCIFTCIITS